MLSIEFDVDPIFKEGKSHGLSRRTITQLVERFEAEYLRAPASFVDLLEVVE